MAASLFSFAARERDVEVVPEFIDRERFADRIHAPELFQQRTQPRGFDAVNFHVPVLRHAPHQFIAHATADEQRASARLSNGDRERTNFSGSFIHQAEGRTRLQNYLLSSFAPYVLTLRLCVNCFSRKGAKRKN
jgi:hypothetical protein